MQNESLFFCPFNIVIFVAITTCANVTTGSELLCTRLSRQLVSS